MSSVMKVVGARHTCAPSYQRRDRIRFLGWSPFQTVLKAGNGTALGSKRTLQAKRSAMAQCAKMSLRPPIELLGNAQRCRYRAGHSVPSATCSRIEEKTSPSSHIETPSGDSILFGLHPAAARAQNMRVPASQAERTAPQQHTIWFEGASRRSLTYLHLAQQSQKWVTGTAQ